MGVRRVDEQGEPTARETQRRAGAPEAVQTVLVVGGAGYIGSTLVRGLLADGYRVRVLDSLEFGDASIRALYNPNTGAGRRS